MYDYGNGGGSRRQMSCPLGFGGLVFAFKALGFRGVGDWSNLLRGSWFCTLVLEQFLVASTEAEPKRKTLQTSP